MTEFSQLERVLLEALAADPQTPRRFDRHAAPDVARALGRLEELGATRMAGSSDGGPWMLTPRGHRLLWGTNASGPSPAG